MFEIQIICEHFAYEEMFLKIDGGKSYLHRNQIIVIIAIRKKISLTIKSAKNDIIIRF